MSTFYSHISHFKLEATLISCSLFIDFQAKTDTITQWIRPSHDGPAPFHDSNPPPTSSKTGLAFLWDQEIPNGQCTCNLWATSPPGSTFNARQRITNKVISSFKPLSTNAPLGGLLADDMGLGKTIQSIALVDTSKERLITNPQCLKPTIIICPPCLITNWQSEISKHAHSGPLQAKIYHCPTHHSLPKANIFQFYIIITSYNTITQELKQTNTPT
ncbi:hypothetical protein O181_128378 [Austropuccinia psidii MF-1]|uniref:SNF2 N-terminal domain-containing protein n=1 Tax=Austropuccinia psidii MF-1 TaxID=1389203 RepID=A0A9Q3Q7T9_9BASI|nr:hypothetical protein [Austropuccinia psidii MF-1]